MRLITVWCVNPKCANQNLKSNIPAGVEVGPGIMEEYTNLQCMACGFSVNSEKVPA